MELGPVDTPVEAVDSHISVVLTRAQGFRFRV